MFLKSVFSTITTPSRFDRDWYGYYTNQVAHIAHGVLGTWLFCAVAFLISDDLPSKLQVFLSISVIYAAKELILDRWQGFDTIEDILFVVVYGAGGTLLSFRQMNAHSPDSVFNVLNALPILVPCGVHLFVGSFARWKAAHNE